MNTSIIWDKVYLSKFPSTGNCMNGVNSRSLLFPDGSYVLVGHCSNPGFTGDFCRAEWDWNNNVPRPKESMAEGWLAAASTGGTAEQADAVAEAIKVRTVAHLRKEAPLAADRMNKGDAAYAAREPNYRWEAKTPDFFVPKGLRAEFCAA